MKLRGNSRGAVMLESTQIRWFSCWPGREARLVYPWPKKTLTTKLGLRGIIKLKSVQIIWFSGS